MFDPAYKIKARPEDFIVEEIPLYEPSGHGDHLYVRFRKTNLNTNDVVKWLAKELNISSRDVGVAGLKDRVAICTQTVSLFCPTKCKPHPDLDLTYEQKVWSLSIPGVDILSLARHPHKLRTGHLKGNRFDIFVRSLTPEKAEDAVSRLRALARSGVPNFYGEQRFGVFKDNVSRTLKWLRDKKLAPRDPKQRRLDWSSVQSEIFNRVLAYRVQNGTWEVPIFGEWLVKEDSGGLFCCEDEGVDRERAFRHEISPTGPIWGFSMKLCKGELETIEKKIAEELLGSEFDLRETKPLGEGTRRALRFFIHELDTNIEEGSEKNSPQECSLRVRFVLRKGAYATTVLDAALAKKS